jgi:hypothetical protein
VIIIDDFLCDDFVEHIQDVIPNLGYKPHFSIDIEKCRFLNSIGDWPATDAFNYVAKKIRNLSQIECSEVLRVYSNLHPSGENHSGDWHEDGNQITALYYPMKWDNKYGGGTEFKDGTVVDYVENRLVLFDANKTHRAMPHTNKNLFRYTVSFKMNGEWT